MTDKVTITDMAEGVRDALVGVSGPSDNRALIILRLRAKREAYYSAIKIIRRKKPFKQPVRNERS